MAASSYTATKEGMTINVWMISVNLWAFTATRNGLLAKGSVNAENRVDAWDLAHIEACQQLWAGVDLGG